MYNLPRRDFCYYYFKNTATDDGIGIVKDRNILGYITSHLFNICVVGRCEMQQYKWFLLSHFLQG